MASPFNLNNLKSNEGSNLARKHDALVDFVRSLVLCPGVGYQISITPLGTILRIKPAKSAGERHPFQLINASEGATKKIRVVYGTVNGETPTGMSEGDDPPYVLTVSGTGFIYLVVTVDEDDFVNSVTIGNSTTIPTSGGAYRLQIGSYSVDAEGRLHIAQAISGSQAFALCGGIVPNWGLV